VDEFRDLFAGAFKELALVGVEAFSSPWQVKLNELSVAQAEAWLDLIERAETLMPDALGMADHFLYVGISNPTQYHVDLAAKTMLGTQRYGSALERIER
jgi:hypothetical protein